MVLHRFIDRLIALEGACVRYRSMTRIDTE